MKTYYATQDIEDMAARGISELVLDENTVLTDLARDAAQRLGIRLIQSGRATASAGAAPARTNQPLVSPASAPIRPKGCQHGPLVPAEPPVTAAPAAPASGGGQAAGNTVVDQMVGLVRQLAGKKQQ